MAQPWMIFQLTKEGNPHSLLNVFYLWNGNWAILIRDGEGINASELMWKGNPPEDLDDKEIKFMNDIASAKRTKMFTLLRNGRHYRVVTRGKFPEV